MKKTKPDHSYPHPFQACIKIISTLRSRVHLYVCGPMMPGFVHDSLCVCHMTCCLCVRNIDLTAEEYEERERERNCTTPSKREEDVLSLLCQMA